MNGTGLDRQLGVEDFAVTEWAAEIRRPARGGARLAVADRWSRYLEGARPLPERRGRGAVFDGARQLFPSEVTVVP